MPLYLYLSVFSQDKYERHTHCTDYDVVPGPEHDPSTWSPLTQLTDELNVTQCIDPHRCLICVFINQKNTHCPTKICIIRKTHSLSNLECLWFSRTLGQWPKIVPKIFSVPVFLWMIVDAIVILVESDSWRWGHGLENWQIFGFPVLIVKLFFRAPVLLFSPSLGVRGWNVNKRRINIAE